MRDITRIAYNNRTKYNFEKRLQFLGTFFLFNIERVDLLKLVFFVTSIAPALIIVGHFPIAMGMQQTIVQFLPKRNITEAEVRNTKETKDHEGNEGLNTLCSSSYKISNN